MREISTDDVADDDVTPPEVVAGAIASVAEKKPAVSSLSREPRESRVAQEMRNNEERNLKDWLEEISPGGAIRVKVVRNSPKVWKGLNVGGSLATYDQQIDEEWIRDHHGGGDYYLTVQKPRVNGAGWQYAGGRVVRIGGDPRTDDVYRDKSSEPTPAAANPANGIVDRVVGSLERQLEREQQRQGQSHGPDTETLKMMMMPMQRQIDQLTSILREKDQQLAESRSPKPVERDEFRDKMLDKLLDGDSARITALRSQYESELRQVKQASMDVESRLRDSFERDKQGIALAHERELNAIRSALDMKVVSQDTLAGATRTLLEGEIRRLAGDLSEAKAELAALRLKKDKSTIETLREASDLREALSDFGGGESKEKSGWEKAIEVAGNLPAVQSVIQKMAGGGEPAPAAQPQPIQMRPQARLMTGPDGNLYRQLQDGQVQLVKRRTAAAKPGEGTPAPIPDIAPATVKIAVDFLESAFRGDQDPSQVATSVRSMIPPEILTAIRERGIDGFLTDVAKLDGTSPLASQGGRNWTRKLGKALLEG
jgi:hypothetical protein